MPFLGRACAAGACARRAATCASSRAVTRTVTANHARAPPRCPRCAQRPLQAARLRRMRDTFSCSRLPSPCRYRRRQHRHRLHKRTRPCIRLLVRMYSRTHPCIRPQQGQRLCLRPRPRPRRSLRPFHAHLCSCRDTPSSRCTFRCCALRPRRGARQCLREARSARRSRRKRRRRRRRQRSCLRPMTPPRATPPSRAGCCPRQFQPFTGTLRP